MLYIAFGQIFDSVQQVSLMSNEVINIIQGGRHIIVLKESLRELADAPQILGVSSMNERHYSYLEHYMNLVDLPEGRPDWIIFDYVG